MSQENKQSEPLAKPKKRMRRVFLSGFVAAGILALVAFVAVDRAMGPLSSDEFCVSCHEMQEVHESWTQARHHTNPSGVKVTCVACHLPPREEYAAHLGAKLWTGAKDSWVHYFGEYDKTAAREHVLQTLPDEWCVKCHDNLLGVPSSKPVEIVHEVALKRGRSGGHGCVTCHDALHGSNGPAPEPKEYEAADNSYCLVCHINFKREEFVVVHKKANVGCEKCHGASDAHGADEDHTNPPDIMSKKEDVNNSCMTAECHPKADLQEEIGHRPFFAGAETERAYCTDCHGTHSIPSRHRIWDKTTRELIFRDGYSTGGSAGGM